MTYVICCDFDGTITLTDTGKALLSNLTKKDWQYYDKLVINGEIGTREALIKQWGMLENVSSGQINEIISKIKIDPTFKSFYEWIKKEQIRFVILSDGFKSYIHKIFQKHEIDGKELDIRANDMKLVNGTIKLEFLTENCSHDCANCKYNHLNNIINEGYSVIYIGDGLSDIFPAKNLAEYIFAREGEDLAKKLEGDSRLLEFKDFNYIRIEIERIMKKAD